MIIQLGIGPEITTTATLGDGTLGMSREPLARVVEVQDVVALETEGGESGGEADVRVGGELGLVGARDADDLETHDAPREVAAAVRAADARVDARRHQGVGAALGLGRGRGRRARAGTSCHACPGGELVLGIAVYAAQRDLARGGLDGRDAAELALLGALDLEFGALKERLVSL